MLVSSHHWINSPKGTYRRAHQPMAHSKSHSHSFPFCTMPSYYTHTKLKEIPKMTQLKIVSLFIPTQLLQQQHCIFQFLHCYGTVCRELPYSFSFFHHHHPPPHRPKTNLFPSALLLYIFQQWHDKAKIITGIFSTYDDISQSRRNKKHVDDDHDEKEQGIRLRNEKSTKKTFYFLLVALPPHCLLQPLPPPQISFHLISCRRRHQIHTSTFSFCDAKTVVVLCCHQDHIISLFSKFQYLHIFPPFSQVLVLFVKKTRKWHVFVQKCIHK